jgi:hypothetical protein
MTTISAATGQSQSLPVLNAVMTAAIAAVIAPAIIGAGFWNSESTSAA